MRPTPASVSVPAASAENLGGECSDDVDGVIIGDPIRDPICCCGPTGGSLSRGGGGVASREVRREGGAMSREARRVVAASGLDGALSGGARSEVEGAKLVSEFERDRVKEGSPAPRAPSDEPRERRRSREGRASEVPP